MVKELNGSLLLIFEKRKKIFMARLNRFATPRPTRDKCKLQLNLAICNVTFGRTHLKPFHRRCAPGFNRATDKPHHLDEPVLLLQFVKSHPTSHCTNGFSSPSTYGKSHPSPFHLPNALQSLPD